ncbi:MAG: PssD/Cps14F family polysaccharide biosynthesis glycosyltransferase [Solirubrobacteraceae bacterium]
MLLVASSGGHLLELLELIGEHGYERRHWVTFDKPDAQVLLDGEPVTFAFSPTNRNVKNLVRNLVLAVRLIGRHRPDAVISTGAGIAVPFLCAARLFGKRAIYVESLARIDQLSLSGRLVYWIVTDFFVQWPELATRNPRSRFVGAIL